MIETSKDILYLVLAFCVLWFTVFLCWSLYYFIRLMKQINQSVEDVRKRFERVTGIFTVLKSKMFTEGVKGLMAMISGFAKKKSNKNK